MKVKLKNKSTKLPNCWKECGCTFEDWKKFTDALFSMSRTPGFKPKKGEYSNKKPSPLITPAVYDEGTTRANVNVINGQGGVL